MAPLHKEDICQIMFEFESSLQYLLYRKMNNIYINLRIEIFKFIEAKQTKYLSMWEIVCGQFEWGI